MMGDAVKGRDGRLTLARAMLGLLGAYCLALGAVAAFAPLFGWAARAPERTLVRAACAAFLLSAVIHLIFHADHLAGFGAADGIAEIAALAALLVPPLIAIRAVGE